MSTPRSATLSFLGHCLVGAATLASIGFLARLGGESVSRVVIGVLAVGGAVIGASLFTTRGWESRGAFARFVRWPLAGALGGGVVASLLFGPIAARPYDLLLGASVGALIVSISATRIVRGSWDEAGTRVTPPHERWMQVAIVIALAVLCAVVAVLVP